MWQDSDSKILFYVKLFNIERCICVINIIDTRLVSKNSLFYQMR